MIIIQKADVQARLYWRQMVLRLTESYVADAVAKVIDNNGLKMVGPKNSQNVDTVREYDQQTQSKIEGMQRDAGSGSMMTSWTERLENTNIGGAALTGYEMMLSAAYGAKRQQG